MKQPRYAVMLLLALLAPAVIAAVKLSEPDILLYPLPQTVYDAEVHLTGLADPHQTLHVELNGQVVTKTLSNERGDFAVTLHPAQGQNRLRVVVPETMLVSDSGVHVFRYMPTIDIPRDDAIRSAPDKADLKSTATLVRPKTAPAAPVITVPPATSTANPITLSGTAEADSNVNFYVNGRFTRSTLANGSGTFSTWVPLEDGTNTIYVTASNTAGETSVASNTVEVSYTHSVPRTQTGTISQNTVWTKGDGTAYSLSGNLTIAPGITLWIQPGALVNSAGNFKILSQGNLVIRGASTALSVLKAANSSCNGVNTRREDWMGIEVPASGSVSLEYAEIQCALRGVYLNGGSGSIQRSRLLNNEVGVRTEAATAVAATFPNISAENEFRGNSYGVSVQKNSRPTISGNNLFTANYYGVWVYGSTDATQNPVPVIGGNRIYSNTNYNYYASAFASPSTTVLDAKGNWWGTTDHGAIAAGIYDWSNSSADSPIVDFSGYLGAAGGTAFFTGTTLNGLISANQTLGPGDAQVLGNITVNPGVTLSIDPGARLIFAPDAKLQVRGTLTISGSAVARAVLRPTVVACNGTATERSDWAGIEVVSGAIATIDYAEVHCAAKAVHFNSGTGEIHNTRLLNNDIGIDMLAVSPARTTPQITTANEINGNAYGIVIRQNTSPSITGGNVVSGNGFGIQITGNSTAAQNPAPVITGNTVQSNSSWNVYANTFGNARSTRVNATSNWWGTTDAGAISRSIRDWTEDSAAAPIVDYSGFLNAAGGTSAWTGPTLNGPIVANQTLTGVEHLMLGTVTVEPGITVAVNAGTQITVVDNFSFVVKGTMNVNGTSASRVVFKPSIAACTNAALEREDWYGIRYEVGSVGAINYADIYCAQTGVYFYQSGTIKNSRLYGNVVGMNMVGASTSAKITPTIQTNEIRNGTYGINVNTNATPTISVGNLITNNDYGIVADGANAVASNPLPVVTGNSLYGNRIYNYRAIDFGDSANILLNARDNWWGTPNPVLISPTIYDRKNIDTSPYVDFGGYLDSAGGVSAFTGTTLIGPITANRTLTPGEYRVLGNVIVSAGATLTINAGAELGFVPGRRLQVNGSLVAHGTSTDRVVFQSAAVYAGKGNWFGLQVAPGGTVDLDYIRMQHSTYGVDFAGGQGTLQRSLIRFNTQGISVYANSQPTITNGNEITSNDYGVYVEGNSTAAQNPAPVVTGNNLYGNSTNNYYARSFGNPTTTILNATGNWWNLTDPVAIRATIYTGSSTSPTVDIGTPLASATGPLAIVVSGVSMTSRQIQPLDSSTPAQGLFTISRPGSVNTQIRRQTDNLLVYQYNQDFATAGQYGFSWNGRDTSGAIVPAGMYRAVLIATDGLDEFVVDSQAPAGVDSLSGNAAPVYRPYKNEFYKASVTLGSPGLISMEIWPEGGTMFYAFQDVYYPAGTHWVYWDGRGPDNKIVTVPVEILTTDSAYVSTTAIQVLIAKPSITGLGVAPSVEVKADPYLVTHSFEQITRMAYRLSDDAYVRFVLLPPEVTDLQAPEAVVLVDNQLQVAKNGSGAPNDYIVEWRGYDPARPSQIRVAPEGAYTFAIEARSSATNQTTVYRGVVNLRQ
ncbi:NosD domain-containing protein [Pseudoxanthomonas sacheonensis]|uniref:Periplasmic copper-binding protein NosD beta helix domain-containing protein n=1 Tax=Pseudoxanthomonas sacheonensis TaxID=443615 RepID=A0ABU1RR18_9GAMM|nr:NosD domain-containing protein [Pseudoxanthomonas sacheonensis]MDR6841217.1 hypothetical protein [Pseudoxanthomonas sacheonensis]